MRSSIPTRPASAPGALDAGGKRSDIAEKTGVVVGVANASLSVERGQVLVGDGDTVVDIGVNRDPALTTAGACQEDDPVR